MGRSHTHHRGVAGGRWKKRAPKTQRVFRPNLQVANLIIDGKVKRVKMCVRCMKRVKKDIRDGKKPFVVLASLKPKTEKKKAVKKSVKKASK
jgi:ribosomal protein L28